MSELREFFDMGGYAPYVWTSFALTVLILGGVVLWSVWEYRKVQRDTLRRARTTDKRSRS